MPWVEVAIASPREHLGRLVGPQPVLDGGRAGPVQGKFPVGHPQDGGRAGMGDPQTSHPASWTLAKTSTSSQAWKTLASQVENDDEGAYCLGFPEAGRNQKTRRQS